MPKEYTWEGNQRSGTAPVREVKTGSKAKNDQNPLFDYTTYLGIRLAQHSTGTDRAKMGPDKKICLHSLQ